MAKRRGEAHGGGHGWFVTFADLMGLLVSFFVMLVAFSTQDQAKLQVVAGSMRAAFGVHDKERSFGARFKQDRDFALASASLRQALQEMPEINEVSKHIMLEDTKEG